MQDIFRRIRAARRSGVPLLPEQDRDRRGDRGREGGPHHRLHRPDRRHRPAGAARRAARPHPGGVDAYTGPNDDGRIAIQVWGESMRDPALAVLVTDIYRRIRSRFAAIAAQAQTQGASPPTPMATTSAPPCPASSRATCSSVSYSATRPPQELPQGGRHPAGRGNGQLPGRPELEQPPSGREERSRPAGGAPCG